MKNAISLPCRFRRSQQKSMAIPHKERLATLHAICLQISRHISQNAREYIKYSLRFLFHLTKNLTTHLSHNLCAVLPYVIAEYDANQKPYATMLFAEEY